MIQQPYKTQQSELRPCTLEKSHYAFNWKSQVFPVKETNDLAIKFCLETNELQKQDYSLELIKRFHSMFFKFLKLFILGEPDLRNKYQLAFLGLFMSNSSPRNTTSVRKIAYNCTIIFRPDSVDDVYNQLVTIFIQLLNAYNPDLTVGFVYYINTFFKYNLKRHIIGKYYNALDYQSINSSDIATDFVSIADKAGTAEEELSLITESTIESDIDTSIPLLDTTRLGVLKGLTNFERYVVYLLTVKGYKRADAAKLFNFTDHNKLNNIINNIKKKTKEVINFERAEEREVAVR